MSLPLNEKDTYRAVEWMKRQFGRKMTDRVDGTPFSLDLLCGIVCQETASHWLPFITTMTPERIVERCVYDASGDYPGTSRKAFPTNTAAFRHRYGDTFTEMLIAEANETRVLRGFKPKQWVYKGYGIFQYDLQHVVKNEAFFRDKQWYDFDVCLERAVGELTQKYKEQNGNLWEAVRAYNGSGRKARDYASNVRQFTARAAKVNP